MDGCLSSILLIQVSRDGLTLHSTSFKLKRFSTV